MGHNHSVTGMGSHGPSNPIGKGILLDKSHFPKLPFGYPADRFYNLSFIIYFTFRKAYLHLRSKPLRIPRRTENGLPPIPRRGSKKKIAQPQSLPSVPLGNL